MARISTRLAVAALATFAVVAATPQDAEARRRAPYNKRLARAPLVMTSFVQNKRTDVARNENLLFKFSAYLRRNSVDERSIRIAAVTSQGLKPATGAYMVRGARVTFDPSRSQRNFQESRRRNSTVIEGDNPEGFASFQDYVVVIPGPPDLHVLRNRRSRGILREFNGSFRSSGSYLDPVPGQPVYVGNFGTGLLGFIPPRSGSTGLVDEDATVVLEFSEPVDINTLDPSSSVTVERVALSEKVPGFIKKDPNSPSGRRFLFVPSLGFGADDLNQQGWDIQVTLTTEITDLAGNSLKRPVVMPVFRTRFVAGKPSASIISESFDDQAQMDAATVTEGGEWNTLELGRLVGGVPTTYPNQDIQYINDPTLVSTLTNDPLVAETPPVSSPQSCNARPFGSRVQMMYLPADVGVAAAITSVSWGPSSNALFAAYHPDIVLTLGHTSLNQLGADFDANFNVGTPQQVYAGDYNIPQALNIDPPGLTTGFWPWPTLESAFEFDGVNNLVFEGICEPANNCQIMRIAFDPGTGKLSNRQAFATSSTANAANFVQPVVYDIRFQKRRRTTRGISLWYEVASDNPIFSSPIISPVGQSGGVEVRFLVQGAAGRPDPFNPGGFIADPTTATPWTADTSEIDGNRFVRFTVEMVANLNTNQTAKVNSVQVPYQF
jgi:hypothetical protein